MDKIGICGGGLIGASWALGFSSNKYKVFVLEDAAHAKETNSEEKKIGDLPPGELLIAVNYF